MRCLGLTLLVLVLATSTSQCTAKPAVNGRADLEQALDALKKAGVFNTFLELLRASGFKPIVARYIHSQPITLLVPTDAAFAALSLRVRSQLTGSKLIKLLEYHMVLQKYTSEYFSYTADGAYFRTVYGVNIQKQRAALQSTVILSPPGAKSPTKMSLVTRPDVGGLDMLTISLQGINRVLQPEKVFF